MDFVSFAPTMELYDDTLPPRRRLQPTAVPTPTSPGNGVTSSAAAVCRHQDPLISVEDNHSLQPQAAEAAIHNHGTGELEEPSSDSPLPKIASLGFAGSLSLGPNGTGSVLGGLTETSEDASYFEASSSSRQPIVSCDGDSDRSSNASLPELVSCQLGSLRNVALHLGTALQSLASLQQLRDAADVQYYQRDAVLSDERCRRFHIQVAAMEAINKCLWEWIHSTNRFQRPMAVSESRCSSAASSRSPSANSASLRANSSLLAYDSATDSGSLGNSANLRHHRRGGVRSCSSAPGESTSSVPRVSALSENDGECSAPPAVGESSPLAAAVCFSPNTVEVVGEAFHAIAAARLAVEVAEAKTKFETRMQRQHDDELQSLRREFERRLEHRRQGEAQLREEILRLNVVIARAYGAVEPPNVTLDSLRDLPSFQRCVDARLAELGMAAKPSELGSGDHHGAVISATEPTALTLTEQPVDQKMPFFDPSNSDDDDDDDEVAEEDPSDAWDSKSVSSNTARPTATPLFDKPPW